MRIGFIDYFLSEWHANNYPRWIEENVRRKGRDETRVCYAYAKLDVSPYDGVTTDEWCCKFGAERCGGIAELVEKSDCIVVLSPDNPEFHEELAEIALKSGKPVYIDKTFAPDPAAAARLFRLAEAHNTPLYSSSALRFAKELDEYRENPKGALFAMAAGSNTFDVYAVHILEILSTVMKRGAKRVMGLTDTRNRSALIDYGEGRKALFCQWENVSMGFQAVVEKDGENRFIPFFEDSFPRFIDRMLNFFERGENPVDKEDTLEIIRLIAAVRQALASPYQWVKV